MKVLIAGAGGLVGKRLIAYWEKKPEIGSILALDHKPRVFEGKKVRAFTVDIADSEALLARFEPESIDVIIHLVGSPGVWYGEAHPTKDLVRNVVTLVSLLELARKNRVKRVVLASTCQVQTEMEKNLGLPASYYGLNKYMAEQYLKLFSQRTGIEHCILRISWIYGPGMVKNPVFDLIQNRDKREIKLFRPMKDELDFIYVDDVATALHHATVNKGWGNKLLDISSNQFTSTHDLISLLEKATGRQYVVQSPESDQPKRFRYSNEEAVRLGWKPEVDIAEGFLRTLDYFKETPA